MTHWYYIQMENGRKVVAITETDEMDKYFLDVSHGVYVVDFSDKYRILDHPLSELIDGFYTEKDGKLTNVYGREYAEKEFGTGRWRGI